MSTSTHLITAEELIEMPDDSHRYELVKEVLLTMSASGADHGMVTANVTLILGSYIKTKKLGSVYAAETGFKLERDPDTVLASDFSFIRKERNPPRTISYTAMAPDLAVEVISSTKSRRYVERKAAQWLSFCVQSVWVVSCQHRTVEVLSANGSRVLFTESEDLSDQNVLPGFRLRVGEIFD